MLNNDIINLGLNNDNTECVWILRINMQVCVVYVHVHAFWVDTGQFCAFAQNSYLKAVCLCVIVSASPGVVFVSGRKRHFSICLLKRASSSVCWHLAGLMLFPASVCICVYSQPSCYLDIWATSSLAVDQLAGKWQAFRKTDERKILICERFRELRQAYRLFIYLFIYLLTISYAQSSPCLLSVWLCLKSKKASWLMILIIGRRNVRNGSGVA